MDRTERFYLMDQLLRQRRVVPMAVFLEQLQISRATFRRDLDYLRERLNAPIEWDADLGGYVLRENAHTGPRYALPGAWFSAAEIQALLSVQQVLGGLQPGWLREQLAPLEARLWAMLGERGLSAGTVEQRIRLLTPAARAVEPGCFQTVSGAVLGRRRLSLTHFNRARNESSERCISPQRLVHYRGTWYVDAWCHQRQALRSFALDAITQAQILDDAALDVATEELDRHLAAGYGIFSGAEVQWARLRFSAERARWVAAESWHPQQRGSLGDDGSYVLELPYSDSRELVMDILRHGRHVQVLAPPSLRQQVAAEGAAIAGLNTDPV